MLEILHFSIGFARQKSIGLPTHSPADVQQNKRKTRVSALQKIGFARQCISSKIRPSRALPSKLLESGETQQIAARGKRVGGFVSERLEFDIVCPNNHNQTVKFSREEFEESLKSGALVFHCNTCDANWPPSSEEIARFRKQFLN